MVATATKAGSGNASAALIGVGLVVLILAGVGYWFSGQADPTEEPTPEEERHLVTFEVLWGTLEDTGETYEDTGKPVRHFRSSDRELTISYWINQERHTADQHDSDSDDPGIWRHHVAVPAGSTVRLLVEQHGEGGWLACIIKQDELTVAMTTRNDAGDCEAEHIVFGTG